MGQSQGVHAAGFQFIYKFQIVVFASQLYLKCRVSTLSYLSFAHVAHIKPETHPHTKSNNVKCNIQGICTSSTTSHNASLTIFTSLICDCVCCWIGIQQSWTSCVQSTLVWWKSWQTATASCSRRNTRGSHWRSATSRMCPSWRYTNPDAQNVYLVCASVSRSQHKNELSCKKKPGQRRTASYLVRRCGSIIREMGGGCRGSPGGRGVGNGSWIGRIVLTLEAGMFEPLCFV